MKEMVQNAAISWVAGVNGNGSQMQPQHIMDDRPGIPYPSSALLKFFSLGNRSYEKQPTMFKMTMQALVFLNAKFERVGSLPKSDSKKILLFSKQYLVHMALNIFTFLSFFQEAVENNLAYKDIFLWTIHSCIMEGTKTITGLTGPYFFLYLFFKRMRQLIQHIRFLFKILFSDIWLSALDWIL